MDTEIVFNEAIIEEREQGIQEIQQQISEVDEIFKDLAVLVHDQGAMIGKFSLLHLQLKLSSLASRTEAVTPLADDIDSHIDNSLAAAVQAKTQLTKASKAQKSNSSLVY